MKNVKKKRIIIFSLIVCLFLMVFYIISSIHSDEYEWWIKNNGKSIDEVRGRKGIDININKVWAKTKGSKNIIVAIIDSGVDISCASIKDSVFVNQNEIANNNVDDDCNGYIDDINGWNFYDGNNKVYTNFTSDYHGTMVASVIAGKHSETKRIGVAPNITILPIKCFRGVKGNAPDVIEAITYAYNMGARIFNCSWDTSIYYEDLEDIMKKYCDAIFICAGGKQQQDLNKNPVYPACFELDNVLCVGAINHTGKLYQYSGRGSQIDVYSPGEHIYCIMPNNKETYSEGTSIATGLVTGVVALLKSEFPKLTVKEIKASLLSDTSEELNILNAEYAFKVNQLSYE